MPQSFEKGNSFTTMLSCCSTDRQLTLMHFTLLIAAEAAGLPSVGADGMIKLTGHQVNADGQLTFLTFPPYNPQHLAQIH